MEDLQRIKVGGEGSLTAHIVVVGESLGENEEKERRPFVGVAGKILQGILEEVGLTREELYITNTYKARPRANDFSSISEDELQEAYRELQEELFLIRPNVIVCLGNEAMRAVLGHAGITNYRGSVLESKYGKVIPTFHPAAIGREWTYRPISVVDWEKIKREAEYPDIKRTHRELTILRNFSNIQYVFEDIKNRKLKVAFDIEVETEQINCISFSAATYGAICIPFWFKTSGSIWREERELKIWQMIKDVLEDESIPKIAQNAQYDMTILRDKYGIRVKNLWLDTMIAFHSVYPELPKALSLLTSIYTDVPYYKYLRITENMDEFFRYNAMDACVTYECAEKIYKEMEDFGVKDFYYEHMHSLIEPLMDITRKGVKLDTEKKKQAIVSYKEAISKAQEYLNVLVGHELNTSSPKQMKEWLYKELKLPVKSKLRKATGEVTESADASILEELYEKYKLEALKVVLDIRGLRKILSTYLEVEYDKEAEVLLCEDETGHITETQRKIVERARCSYLITGTETGRLSSRETVYHTGTNLQNVPKGICREIFIPDTGCIFVNADLSQAEARVVAYLAGEDRLIRVFESGGDIHKLNAANIFRIPLESVTNDQRELAKRLVHASNYGMGPVTFAKEAGIQVSEAKRCLNAYFAQYPKIKLWQMQVSSQLRKARTLTTPLGRKRTFFNRWSEQLLKEALAYQAQSTVADILNMGLRRFYEKTKGTDTQILLQIHDAILCQSPVQCTKETCQTLRDCLTIPISIGRRSLTIPCDISIGMSWDNLKRI